MNVAQDLPPTVDLPSTADRGLPLAVGHAFVLQALNILKCIEKEKIMGDLKDTMIIITMVARATGEIFMKVVNWERRVEALFYAYGIFEEDKLQLEHRVRNRSRPIISWESLKRDLRDKFGILDHQEVETSIFEFCDPLCKKRDNVYMEEKYKRESNGIRCHEMLKGKHIKKASRVEESS
ncbi:hypothetical protein M9H77_32138 [Catharanthus roseus]|uniref:Uncharacterized protein n=1 Tax=Catharanthus roseus TaxID=4058 RepID=A0ACC0A306_CATRO|nr:hypothetical protein M9H77_32138 [Catharanthus roseus]